jgi:ABC-2 type transport system permease protein
MRNLLSSRLGALIRKEFHQIRRDSRLAATLTLQPVVQMLLLGFALSATVTNIRLGVTDNSHTTESRALVATLTESRSFRLAGLYLSEGPLGDALSRGDVDAGIVIPSDYSRDLQRGRTATVQVLLNAVNANTATIGQGYVERVVQSYGQSIARAQPHGAITLQPAYLYNPGLEGSWFLVTGVFGLLLILNASLVAETTMIKERESGTIEQLLMSPASTAEIVIAKIAPLFGLLCIMVVLSIAVMKVVFQVPFLGSVPLLLWGSALCLLCGISLGTVSATYSQSARQAMMIGFFVNPSLFALSGALNPVEAMPRWLQPLTVLNPIHHFATIARGILVKGSGLVDLWPNFLGLMLLTTALLAVSIVRFRKQIS